MQRTEPNHYATLGLHQACTVEQIRAAYRVLAKQHHPDVNQGSSEASLRTQQLNIAYDTLSNPERRRAYDDSQMESNRRGPARATKTRCNISEDVHLRIEEFFRGTMLDVRVNDPGNPEGPEIYQLTVPPETAPGTRFRLERTKYSGGGFVLARVRLRPHFRFKARGSDLRCDLRISAQRAAQGGLETIVGATGARLRVTIPRHVARGEIVRVPGEGLPKPRGGRGDLLVRITYRPEVRISRSSRR